MTQPSVSVNLDEIKSTAMMAAFKTKENANANLASYFVTASDKKVQQIYRQTGAGLYPCVMKSNVSMYVAGLCITKKGKYMGEIVLRTPDKHWSKVDPADDRSSFTIHPLGMEKIRDFKHGIAGATLMEQLEADMDAVHEVFLEMWDHEAGACRPERVSAGDAEQGPTVLKKSSFFNTRTCLERSPNQCLERSPNQCLERSPSGLKRARNEAGPKEYAEQRPFAMPSNPRSRKKRRKLTPSKMNLGLEKGPDGTYYSPLPGRANGAKMGRRLRNYERTPIQFPLL